MIYRAQTLFDVLPWNQRKMQTIHTLPYISWIKEEEAKQKIVSASTLEPTRFFLLVQLTEKELEQKSNHILMMMVITKRRTRQTQHKWQRIKNLVNKFSDISYVNDTPILRWIYVRGNIGKSNTVNHLVQAIYRFNYPRWYQRLAQSIMKRN